jgi:hypothetical protein
VHLADADVAAAHVNPLSHFLQSASMRAARPSRMAYAIKPLPFHVPNKAYFAAAVAWYRFLDRRGVGGAV